VALQLQSILSDQLSHYFFFGLQDSPNLKLTYSAEIKTPSHLVALMSALSIDNVEDNVKGHKIYRFQQHIKIPVR